MVAFPDLINCICNNVNYKLNLTKKTAKCNLRNTNASVIIHAFSYATLRKVFEIKPVFLWVLV